MRKGFTLIEMLAVLVILSVIALITIPIVSNQMNEAKQNLYDKQVNTMIEATKNWSADNLDKMQENQNVYVTLGELQDDGYLNKNIENPKTKKEFDRNMTFKIFYGKKVNITVSQY